MKWIRRWAGRARGTRGFAGLACLLLLAARPAAAQTVYTWNGGDIVTGSITPSTVSTINPADTFNIATGADHDFNGARLTNNGTVNWQAGNLRSGNGGGITNNAAWNDGSNGFQINSAFGGASTTFTNSATGVYTKTAGTTDFTIGFTNAGTINVTGGTLNLDAGGTFTNGSVLSASGTGVLQLKAGTLVMTGSITATNFLFNGGNFAGDQTFVNSTLNWQGGSWNSGNTTTLAPTTTLNVISGNDHDFSNHAIVNNGTVNWQTGNLRSGNGGGITNNATWNDSVVSYQVNSAFGGGTATFVNAAGATYNKTGGTTDFTIGFTNAGTLNVTNGTLNLDAGGTFTNGSVVGATGSGVLQLLAGTLTMTGNITATNFLFNGGTLAGDQTFLNSLLNWQGGNWNSTNTTTIGATTTLNIISGNDHDFSNHAIVNNGTINWQTGNLRSGNGGSLTNNATWNDTVVSFQINNAYGGAGATFVNGAGGSYNKISGLTSFEVPFTNYGTVAVTGGTLNLDQGGTFYAGSTIGSSGLGVVQLTNGVLGGGGTGGFTATNLVLAGGQVADGVTFLGTTNWTGTNFNTSGISTVGAAGVLNIVGGNDHDYSNHTMVNNGTINWQAGNVRSGNGGLFTNNGVWNDSANSYAINDAYGGAGTVFHNAAGGLYNKTAGSTTIADGVLVNDGTISVSGGVLSLVGGTLNAGSSIGSSGSGVVQLASGLLTVNGNVNVQNLQINGGQLTGVETFAGTLTWNAGNLNTAGTMVIGGGSTLTIAGGSDHDYSAHTLVNDGSVNWLAGNLRSGNGGSFTNNGVWNDSANNYAINDAYGGAAATFLNAGGGVYNKTAGSTTIADGVLVNDGTISVSGGVLSLIGGTLDNGSTIGSSGAGTVQLTSGVLTASGVVNVQNFLFNGGQITGTQTFQGSLSWVGGNLNTGGTMTIGNAGLLDITSGNDHDFNAHPIVNAGTVDWISGNLRTGNGATITNYGIWNDSGSTYAINGAFGGAPVTFVNAVGGTYDKTAGSSSIQIPVVNLGLINITGGTLALTSSYADAAGQIALATGTTFSSSNALSFSAGSLLSGTGTVAAPSIAMSGAINPGTPTSAGQLTLNGNLVLLAPAFTDFVIGGVTQGSQYGYLSVNGSLTLGGNLQLSFINGFESSVNSSMTFDLISSTSLSSSFLNVANGSRLTTADGLGSFVVNYGPTSAFGVNDVVLTNFASIPEPSTWALFILGGSGALAFMVRQRRAPSRRV